MSKLKYPTQDYSSELINKKLLRNFPLDEDCTLIFYLQGGIGNHLIYFETIQYLKSYLQKNSTSNYEFVAYIDKGSIQFWSSFFQLNPIFKNVEQYDLTLLDKPLNFDPLKYSKKYVDGKKRVEHLVCHTAPYRIEAESLFDCRNKLWAEWGLPGHIDLFKLHNFTFDLNIDDRKQDELLIFNSSVSSNDDKKLLPLDIVDDFLKLLKAEHPTLKVKYITRKKKNAIFNYKYDAIETNENLELYFEEENPTDFVGLAQMISQARAVISIDTAPAHIVGHLKLEGIILWGPTSPLYYGNLNNHNVRLSQCPACSNTTREELCQIASCMRELSAEILLTLVNRRLSA